MTPPAVPGDPSPGPARGATAGPSTATGAAIPAPRCAGGLPGRSRTPLAGPAGPGPWWWHARRSVDR